MNIIKKFLSLILIIFNVKIIQIKYVKCLLYIKLRTSPHMYLWRKQWNWMSSTMLFKQNRIV
ncbi:hypothetical protein [Spiroplasma ixodetis]|uniref:hypothetical protein n=1 Tax=Spiroplasma ixodetis TaxID=2141 RepID=UPI0025770BDA|nr:hypothetical protein [Spiroplasma ixodetis]